MSNESTTDCVPVTAGGLRLSERTADKLDRQIVEAETYLSNLQALRDLLKKNPLMEELHDALRRVGL